MVLSSLLAASASHMQLTHGRSIAVHRFKYRSITFAELQQASDRQNPEPTLPLLALSAILGLLIDDMIAGAAEFPALLQMTQFWIREGHHQNHGPREKTTLRFLLDQIQMYVTILPFGVNLNGEVQEFKAYYLKNENTCLSHVQD
jgi:hypothetical protein